MYRQMYRMYRPTHCSLLRHTLLHVTAVHAVLSPLLPAASPVLLNALPGYPAASTTRPDVPFHLPTTLPQAAAEATCLRAAAPPSTPSCTAQARRCSYTTPHLARSAAACAVQRHAHQPAGPPNPAPSSLPLTLPFLPPHHPPPAIPPRCPLPSPSLISSRRRRAVARLLCGVGNQPPLRPGPRSHRPHRRRN